FSKLPAISDPIGVVSHLLTALAARPRPATASHRACPTDPVNHRRSRGERSEGAGAQRGMQRVCLFHGMAGGPCQRYSSCCATDVICSALSRQARMKRSLMGWSSECVSEAHPLQTGAPVHSGAPVCPSARLPVCLSYRVQGETRAHSSAIDEREGRCVVACSSVYRCPYPHPGA